MARQSDDTPALRKEFVDAAAVTARSWRREDGRGHLFIAVLVVGNLDGLFGDIGFVGFATPHRFGIRDGFRFLGDRDVLFGTVFRRRLPVVGLSVCHGFDGIG